MLTATELRVGLVFLVLTFGLSFVIPAEDIAATTYDESEALLYESTLVVSTVLGPAQTDHSALTSTQGKPRGALPFLHERSRYAVTNRFSVAQLCTLLC